jgi:aspartyl protease family protein
MMVSSFGKVAAAVAVSALATAGALGAFGQKPLRMARLDAEGFNAAAVRPGSGAVAKGTDGHFWADAQVNGQPVHFLVDTGATAVALTRADAEKLGIRPQNLKYGYNVTTAGGASHAAAVTLASVSVNGARLENVQALVVSDGLDVSLLGMSYLGRLSRFEATRDTLRFEP